MGKRKRNKAWRRNKNERGEMRDKRERGSGNAKCTKRKNEKLRVDVYKNHVTFY